MQSLPPFPKQSGTCIVVGCAPSACVDLRGAMAARRDARIMTVNAASALIPADYVTGLDMAEVKRAADEQAARFLSYPTRHLPYPPLGWRVEHFVRRGEPIPEEAGFYDFAWPGARCGATSGWCGARIAKAMGFEEVILAGITLNSGGYVDFPVYEFEERAWGDPALQMHERYRARLREYVAAGDGEGVFSMSGFTAELLGRPHGIGGG